MADETRRQNLVSLLDAVKGIEGDRVSVADLQKVLGRRAFGPLLIIAGLLATLPTGLIPGMGWGTGALMTVICVQLLLGAHRLVLPGFLTRRSLSRDRVMDAVERARPWAERVSRYTKPRLEFFFRAPFVQLVSLSGLLMSLTMFPLGSVPFGAFPGGISSIVIGIGFVVRDGVFLAAGLALGVLGVLASLALISLL